MENSAVISRILIRSRQEPQPGCQVFNPSWTPFKAAVGTFFQCGEIISWNPLTQHYLAGRCHCVVVDSKVFHLDGGTLFVT